VQVSRFDRWKDPVGVIEAFRKAAAQVDATMRSTMPRAESFSRPSTARLTSVLTADDPNLVNALQRRAAVVLQKSIREGFGLTVTAAMWKGAPVIGGNVGGIRRQIRDGEKRTHL
jgi:trehalose synthase